jgi:hypothetical protein
MNNHESTRITTNPERLLFKDEFFQIVGCAIEVRITTLRVGVILNFKHRKLEWERIVL